MSSPVTVISVASPVQPSETPRNSTSTVPKLDGTANLPPVPVETQLRPTTERHALPETFPTKLGVWARMITLKEAASQFIRRVFQSSGQNLAPLVTKAVVRLDQHLSDSELLTAASKLHGLAAAQVAAALVAQGKTNIVAENIFFLNNLDITTARSLIQGGHERLVNREIRRFTPEAHPEIAEMLIAAGTGDYLCFSLTAYQNLDHQVLALRLIEAGSGQAVASQIKSFGAIDHLAIASSLAAKGHAWFIASHIADYPTHLHPELARLIVEAGETRAALYNVEKFQGINHQEFLDLITSQRKARDALDSLHTLLDIDHLGLARAVISEDRAWDLCYSIHKFPAPLHREIADLVIEHRQASYVGLFINKFSELSPTAASTLAKVGHLDSVLQNSAKFAGLSDETVRELPRLAVTADVNNRFFRRAQRIAREHNISDQELGSILESRLRGLATTHNYDHIADHVSWYVQQPEHLDRVSDLPIVARFESFIRALASINASDTKSSSASILYRVIRRSLEKGVQIEKPTCDIPDNAFIQVFYFVKGSPQLLDAIHSLYRRTKSSTDQERFLTRLVDAALTSQEVIKECFSRLPSNLTMKEATHALSLIRGGASIDEGAPLQRLIDETQGEISIAALEQTIRENLNYLLSEKLTDDEMRSIIEGWNSLEPIVTYASKLKLAYPALNAIFTEALKHSSSPEQWKAWRYDRDQQSIVEQVGHLSPEQLHSWRQDRWIPLGDASLQTSGDLPKRIFRIIHDAISVHDHLSGGTLNFARDELLSIFLKLSEDPELRTQQLHHEIAAVREEILLLSHLTKEKDLKHLTTIHSQLVAGEVQGKVLKHMDPYLEGDLKQRVKNLYELRQPIEGALVDQIHSAILYKLETLRARAADAQRSRVLERHDLLPGNLEGIIRRLTELKVTETILSLASLTHTQLSSKLLGPAQDDSASGMTILQGVEFLLKERGLSETFRADLANVEHALQAAGHTHVERKTYAALVTDDPELILHIGVYPRGSTSCQNYGGSDYNRALVAYIADAHIKATFLIDLGRLNPDAQEEIRQADWNTVRRRVSNIQLLEASVARAVIKVVRDSDNAPAIFVEPSYPREEAIAELLQTAALSLADEMNVIATRGGGTLTVAVPASCSPEGQYEDGAAGHAGHAGLGIQKESYTMTARQIVPRASDEPSEGSLPDQV